MQLAIASVGTRGDAQPYVALGKALQDRGHQVTLVTHEDHRSLAESHGLGFRPVCGSFRELLDSLPGRRWLQSSDNPLAYLRTFRELFGSVAEPWLADFDAALDEADAVLVHSFAFGAITALERRGTPRVVLSPFAALPSGQLGSLGLPRVPWLTGSLERLAFGYLLDQAWKVAQPSVEGFRRRHGIAPSRTPVWRQLASRGLGHLHLFSEQVAPRPNDWPACAEVTGYCFLDADEAWRPPDALADFLASGAPPVYVGFGSMTGMDPAALARTTRDALRAAGRRAVIGMGWGALEGIREADDLLVVDDVPHDWLFQRVAAVVHHGGAGTTAAALRAGKPSVVVPFFGDQPYWARRLARLGVGPAPIPKKKLTAARLGAAIEAAVTDRDMTPRAADLGRRIAAEDGAGRTADRALHHLARVG